MGSTAQIMRNWGHPENESLLLGSVKPAWGNPIPVTIKAEMPTIPCIGIYRIAGGYLVDQLAKGPVRIHLRTSVENVWRDLQMTIGALPGVAGEDFVLIGDHQDGWYGEGALDNAAGNACMLELARVFGSGADSCSASGPGTRPVPWSGRVGLLNTTGTAGASMRSPT